MSCEGYFPVNLELFFRVAFSVKNKILMQCLGENVVSTVSIYLQKPMDVQIQGATGTSESYPICKSHGQQIFQYFFLI